MNRDALLATVIGFGVGLLITGVVLLGPNVRSMLPNISWPNFFGQKNTHTTSQTQQDIMFTIDSPLADAIEARDEVLVSGAANPQATVVLMGAADEVVVVASDEGKWAGRLSLVEGANDITATMYVRGEATTRTVTVFYTPEEF